MGRWGDGEERESIWGRGRTRVVVVLVVAVVVVAVGEWILGRILRMHEHELMVIIFVVQMSA